MTKQQILFLLEHHKDGTGVFGKNRYNIALFNDKSIVAVASFSNPRTKDKKREYQHKLVRLAFHKDYRIVGGVSKLIKGYISDVNPKNFFTYQTMSGEHTDVYTHSGMQLREYSDNHVEMIQVDDVYEYENPNYTHYIYKITSSDPTDPKYYIGRRSLYSENNMSEVDLLADTYMGSGGKAYQQWVSEVLSSGHTLVKTILKVSESFRLNIKDEETILGDLYQTDENCLNAVKGGITLASTFFTIKANLKLCKTHGETLHRGIHCLRCLAGKPVTLKTCEHHGSTLFRGSHCLKCVSKKSISVKHCQIHGDTIHNGNTCVSCQDDAIHTLKVCEQHGETIFKGDTCAKCTAAKSIEVLKCPIHGYSKHRGGACLTCQVQSVPFTMGHCSVHGQTKFKKDKCMKCSSVRQVDTCAIHGLTKFSGGKCISCHNSKQYHMAECPIHGHTKFRKDICFRCSRMKHIPEVTDQYCDICQTTQTHLDGDCKICLDNAKRGLYHCKKHGLTKHRGKKCCLCSSEDRHKIKNNK